MGAVGWFINLNIIIEDLCTYSYINVGYVIVRSFLGNRREVFNVKLSIHAYKRAFDCQCYDKKDKYALKTQVSNSLKKKMQAAYYSIRSHERL